MVLFYGYPVACLVNGGSLLEGVATTFPSGGTASLLLLCFVTVLLTRDTALTGPSECSVKGGVSHPAYVEDGQLLLLETVVHGSTLKLRGV